MKEEIEEKNKTEYKGTKSRKLTNKENKEKQGKNQDRDCENEKVT